MLRNSIAKQLKKHSYVHREDFVRPYIVKKHIEGVDFLLSITDSHAKLWYDLYCTDPVWVEMRFIRDNLIRSEDVVFECGSHHGCTAILLAHWVGAHGVVYAFEPGKGNYDVLRENISLNNMTNVVPINAAVGNANDVVYFTEYPNGSMDSQVTRRSKGHVKQLETCYAMQQVSLDNCGLDNPSLIKIDTQGYVYEPLQGMRKIITEQKPNLALEIDSKETVEKYGDNFENIFEIIKQDEYIYFIQFDAREEPQQIEHSKILQEWEKKNGFTKEIHLYAKNSRNR